MTQQSSRAVEVSDLVRRYGSVTAVDGVSLDMDRGTVLALLGPNGAGKTTLVEVCEGLRHPDEGSVRVLGTNPYENRAADRDVAARIGVMLQEGGVYPAARPLEVLRLQASLFADPADPVDLLDLLGLTEVANRPYRRLSGGEQQRVSLALALVGRPELVFLDEPTAGLDPQARHTVWEIIERLRRDGVSVFLTTHLLDEAERLADKVVIIDHGQVVAEGTPAELTRQGRGEGMRFRARPGLPLDSLRMQLSEQHTVTEAPAGTYSVSGEVNPQTLALVTSWCAEQGVMPEGLSIGQRSLEDVFLELTSEDGASRASEVRA